MYVLLMQHLYPSIWWHAEF